MKRDASNRATLGEIHDAAVAAYPDRTAVVDARAGTRLTYAEFGDAVGSSANALAGLGVGRGDRVAMWYPNGVRYLVAMLAVSRVGGVPVPVNRELDRGKLAYVLDDCGTSVVVVHSDDAVTDRFASVLADAEGIETVVVDAHATGLSVPGARVVSLRERAAAADAAHEPTAVDPGDPAMQPYTSGTTGRPKGVVLTHGGVSWCTNAFVDHLGLGPSERGLVITPLYHKNAMTGVVKPMLATGGSLVVLPEFDADAALDAVAEYDVTYLTGVPAVYKRLVGTAADREGDDVPSTLTWASCGSAPVPASLVESFAEQFGADLLEVYGLTEGGPVVCHSPRDGPRKVGSAGPALPGVETRVVDPETGEERPTDESGELLVASPGLGTYHKRPDAEAEHFEVHDGTRWLHTGDLARKDSDGYHYIVGRLDDMLIVGGENCYPADVENRLLRHEAVEDVAVVSVPHAEKGEAPVAFVTSNEPVTEADLQTFALERGPAFAHPRRVFFVDELPLSGTGKVSTETLRERAIAYIGGEL